MGFGIGLSLVSEEELRALLIAVHRKRLTYPLTKAQIMLMGLHGIADHADNLVGLDEAGVRAVIVAVLAERRAKR